MTTLPDTEAAAVAIIAQQAITPRTAEPSTVYAVLDDDGGVRITDTDAYGHHPRRATAARTVIDAFSFVTYVERHGIAGTEIYADPTAPRILALINAHEGAEKAAGWQDHRVSLEFRKTPEWEAWEQFDGKLFTQTQFAEFIELRALDVTQPTPAELLDLAQFFEAKRNLDYESSDRLADGQVSLTYKETVTARAGQKGNIEIPEYLRLVLRPFIGGPAYRVNARFRYRLDGSKLLLGYVLERPARILEDAFTDILRAIANGVEAPAATDEAPVGRAVTPHAGLAGRFPIFTGRP